MSPAQPEGTPAPTSGALPGGAANGASARPFSVYLHVPFCAVRCGYCDFNTYTAQDLGGGATQEAYAETACKEIDLAASVMEHAGLPDRPVSTVFFGGGTPTLLPARDLARMLMAVRATWSFAAGAEISVEANPDSVTPESLDLLADAGVNRVSFGMQSAVRGVLRTLDRTHCPERVPLVVEWARRAGLEASLDLIYGTPGERLADWRASLDAALATGVDHISAYALTIEPGTRMWGQIRRGELPEPSGDDEAEKYELADRVLSDAGLAWYEISNFARPGHESRHNLGYWLGHDWWGIGPGAHSAFGGQTPVRWWNVKHPRAYAQRLCEGISPAAGRDLLDAEARELERVMLRIRLREGLDLAEVSVEGRASVPQLISDGLLDPASALDRTERQPHGRAVLTLRGRMLADVVTRVLTA